MYHIPSSLSRMREAIKGGSTTLRPPIVNGESAIVGRTVPTASRVPLLLLLRVLCITLQHVVRCSKPAQWGWRVKRESGESA